MTASVWSLFFCAFAVIYPGSQASSCSKQTNLELELTNFTEPIPGRHKCSISDTSNNVSFKIACAHKFVKILRRLTLSALH